MAAARRSSLYFCFVFSVSVISLTVAQDQNQFIYNGFVEAELHLDGAFIHSNGLLQLTDTFELSKGHAFYKIPIKFNTSSYQSLSFSTTFVFSMVTGSLDPIGHGMAFVISPSMDFIHALNGPYLGLFNFSSNGLSTNHIFAVEVDTAQSPEFKDINGNHVGIDVNSLISIKSAPAAYFSDETGQNISLELISRNPIQMWIDYSEAEKLLNVTVAPITIPKPSRPLLSESINLSQTLSDSMYVGFSAATGLRVSNQYILGWSFNKSGHTQNLNVSNLPSLPPLSPKPRKTSQKPRQIIIVLVVAVVVVLITIGGAVYIVRKKKYEEVWEDWEKEYGPQRFSYVNLYEATNGFKDKELIGKGGFGTVYRGVLPSSKEQIAVKRVSHGSNQGIKEFVTEIISLGRLRHRNLVQLRGYCRRKGELLLVYDYMSNGSLDKILYSDTGPILNWFQRFRILRGAASGLHYLHEEWEQVVLHRDIKPGNVLLDADLNGKLGDFGFARFYDHGSNPKTTKVVGTIGYIAPELLKTGKATTSTDVYAFGVFILELACGRRPTEQEGCVIDCWKRGAILDACDPRLECIYVEEQMELILKLGLLCSHPNPTARPTMRQVMQYLDGDATLPDIPPDGVTSLFTTTSESSDSVHTMSTTDSILKEGR